MSRFKVISLSLGGLRNKIFESGDVVTQEQLPVSVDELVEKGFLKPLDNAPRASEKTAPAMPEVSEPSVLAAIQAASDEVEAAGYPDMDDMTVKEIKEALGDRLPKKYMPKADLYALLVG